MRPGHDPPYVVLTTRRGDIDRPIPGSRAPGYHYDGSGGIALSGLLRRAASAARFGDLKLLLTETVTDRSRIVIHRDAGERVRALAPFLHWDAHAQTVVAQGRVQYLFHGYTTSTLFNAQARAYAGYHASDPTGFWSGADAWQLPLQLAGPIEGAGEIHFPDPRENFEATDDARHARWPMRPDYLFARLPGDTHERLMLVTPYTPRGRQNLAAYLAGSIDGDGTPRLTLLSLPRDRLTIGPTQATHRILAHPEVSRRLELLNRESRDLGRAAVNRTILGDARLVPIGGTLVHVQPVYVVAGGNGLPRLQLVTAYADGRVGYGRDLEAALRRVVAR
jgi:uncharacterized protein